MNNAVQRLVGKSLLLILLLFPIIIYAKTSLCMDHRFLQKGFSLKHYTECKTLIGTCPNNGPLPGIHCVKIITAKNKVCSELNNLANQLQTDPSLLTAKQYNNLILIDQFFPGDGQHQYHIITPQSCLIDTHIDPRTLSVAVRKKTHGMNFLIVNWGAPTYKMNADGTQAFDIKLRISDNCLACELIGWAEITLNFDKLGNMSRIDFDKLSHDEN